MSTNGHKLVEIRFRAQGVRFVLKGPDLEGHLRILEHCLDVKIIGKVWSVTGPEKASMTSEFLLHYAGLEGGN